ncbi:MGDG synthase family glycosyltransferase [Desertibacillus haloalkaliphilus]|uniref:MGDG synthase family glycosyltransferase n=1 Tax=Desertibacillus haloalkaliphilus TaxID=1328930 RepID=UPI001C251F4E|nr:glycosyltransferase [Desertibacillus haloalkaliphilus]MBU8906924.1 glycosyltransferase [Desertibacillus haloalkaliphilus]
MKRQPYIFSASIGHGHNQAAKALHYAFTKKGYEPNFIDTFHAISPKLHKFMLTSYLQMLKLSPVLWRKIYFYAEDHPLFLALDRFGSFFSERIYTMLLEHRCNFMISTHPFVTAFLAKMKQKKGLNLPLYTVITDFVLHPAYVREEIDGYFTASADTNEFASLYNVPAERFFSTGIPFVTHPCLEKTKWKARYDLHLDHNKKILLIAGGGIGLTNYPQVIRALETLREPIQIVCMTGHNMEAKQQLLKQKSKHDVKAVEFTDQFLLYLKASDAVLSKAGGLTMAESLACETPIVIFQPVPGHEEHNAKFLTENGAAVHVNDYEGLSTTIESVLYHRRQNEKMKKKARVLKRPNAANQIVDEILLLFEQQEQAAH